MKLEEALRIIDPDTCHDALAVYAGDCDMLHAKAVEASRIVMNALRAAIEDLTLVTSEYDCRCMVCAGGLGLHNACSRVDEDGDMPSCNDCNQCICGGCSKTTSHFKWRGEA